MTKKDFNQFSGGDLVLGSKKSNNFDSVKTSHENKDQFCLTDCLFNSSFNDDIIIDPVYERYQAYYQKFND